MVYSVFPDPCLECTRRCYQGDDHQGNAGAHDAGDDTGTHHRGQKGAWNRGQRFFFSLFFLLFQSCFRTFGTVHVDTRWR